MNKPPSGKPGAVQDERITRRDAVANALLQRYSPTLFPLEDAARQYRGMTLLELARESLGNAGVNTRGLGMALRQIEPWERHWSE